MSIYVEKVMFSKPPTTMGVEVGVKYPKVSLLGIALNIQVCTEKSCMEPLVVGRMEVRG